MKHPSVKGNYKYYSYCIECERTRNRAWKERDSASGNKKLRQIKYLSTERGYF